MSKRRRLYEGKAKILYAGPRSGTLVQHFKDSVTAFNREKEAIIEGKGVLANRISEYIFQRLGEVHIPTHFIEVLNMREQLIRALEMLPLEVVVRNIAAGSLVKRLGLDEGAVLVRPVVEFYYKDDSLGDPLVSEDHILALGWARGGELDEMTHLALRVNDYLSGLFSGIGIRLIDFKLEFGRFWGGDLPAGAGAGDDGEVSPRLLLGDEFSPDNCRLWDIASGDRLDKDRFRQDLGGVLEAYLEVARRLNLSVQLPPKKPRARRSTPRLVKG